MDEELFFRIAENSFSCDTFNQSYQHLQLCRETKHCLSYLAKDVNLTVFQELCSVLNRDFQSFDTIVSAKPSPIEVWGYGILCVSLISLTSVVGVAILPLMSKVFYSRLLSALIGLAVGSLSGSAVFHLIPSAFSLKEVDFFPHHGYLNISMAIWLGMYLFFILERCLRIFMDARSRRQGIPFNHSHTHTNIKPTEEQESLVQLKVDTNLQKPDQEVRRLELEPSEQGRKRESSLSAQDSKELYQQSRQAIRASFGHMDKPHPNNRPTVDSVKNISGSGPENRIATVAWMIIFGDGIHNFIDGLSIGAAFSESILTGISVSVAVLCEEFPHELGDFAVLLNAGMTMKEALLYNFLSACTCYLGLILGILLGELDANSYIFGLAGGMFLYISLVDMVPEMNESVETASKTSTSSALGVFLLQNIGILVGIVCLYTLARFQDDIQFG
ncbi:zinc transporter ZIP14 [Eurytemora carolleeae]|uniref:zinc transporter ZIP14 n=1 Tax=Eurytemora carolleeae TaxID=1294199 RepID=UPI000C787BB6|nr:zinc transporter ZIP14 [Eurytemora carolleeae]|eukprot:XP_023338022.1 zinc transporter ZIP14-like [Eurytemora affinis]